MRSRTGRRGHGGGERGITVVFFAIAITAILTVAALILGGSVGYEAARNSQTAADAAALAGASALQNHKQDWITTPADAVLAEITSVVATNGSTLQACHLVRAGYALTGAEADVIAPCSQLAFLPDAQFQTIAGVRVRVVESRDVPFAAFVDQKQITARSTAAATIQPVARGGSPFMVCTAPTAVGHPAPALVPDGNDPTGYRINEAAVGGVYVLWGNQIKNQGRDCGNPSSSWRGLVQLPLDGYPLPSTEATPGNDTDWWAGDTGNKTGQLGQRMAGGNGCTFAAGDSPDSIKVGCDIAVPLCPKGNVNSGSAFKLFCVRMGVFRITHVGNVTADLTAPVQDSPCGKDTTNIICGRFIGGAAATGGQGVAQQPDRHGFAVIKLVQ